jgi:hypothetical protein
MSPKKNGRIFIILMIALVAFGFGSAAHAFGLAQDFGTDLIPSDLFTTGAQQISEISDPSFNPVYLTKRVIVNTNNTTNTTNSTRTNNTIVNGSRR